MNSTIPVACGKPHRIEITSKSCNGDECNRAFYIYLPSIMCQSEEMENISVLPLVFVLHCFGCQAQSMFPWLEVASVFNFVMIIPEGLDSSWNAKYCCGYSLKNKIDDVGFLGEVINKVTSEMSVVRRDMIYGVGWSNGGYLVSLAANFFRSIVPIAGYQYDDDVMHSIENNQKSLSIFQHHSLNDNLVQYNGCCNNPLEAQCCCRISQSSPEQCMSVESSFDDWANNVNKCSSMEIAYKDQTRGIECRTGVGCSANSTLCIYEKAGHFGAKHFPMFDEVGDFFARNACESDGFGSWDSSERHCICKSGDAGNTVYCFRGSSGLKYSENATHEYGETWLKKLLVSSLLIATILAIYYRKLWKYQRRINKKGWESLSTVDADSSDIELTEHS